MARPLSGNLVKRKGVYHVLLRPNGQEHFIDLETTELDIARQRKPRAVRKFLAGQTKKADKGPALIVPAVTMAEVADAYYASRREMGIKTWDDEKRWWAKHATSLHELAPKNVTATLVETALLDAKAKGIKSLDAIRLEVDKVLRAAKKQRLVTEVVTDDVTLPRVEGRKKKRVQLTDAEFVQYLMHPDTMDFSVAENTRRIERGELPLISREVKTLAVVARCVGGARASDLHALCWEMIDLPADVIAIFRPKVSHRSNDDEDATDVYRIPPDVKPYLEQWHRDHGRPESGPVFPCTLAGHWKEGVRKYGGAKSKKSYAAAFKRDLKTAGVTRHELHHDGIKTRSTDFHSLRRGLVSAMRRAQIPTRLAMAIVHHTSKATHDAYDTMERDVMEIPAAALPSLPRPKLLTAGSVQASEPDATQNPNNTKSSNNHASSGELTHMQLRKSLCEKSPEPPEFLAATGTYGPSEFRTSVEAPGIEGNLAFSLENFGQHPEPGHVAESEPVAGSAAANASAASPTVKPGGLVGEDALRTAMAESMAAGDWAEVQQLALVLAKLQEVQVKSARAHG